MQKIQISLPIMFILAVGAAYSQEVAFSRRLLNVSTFLGSIEKKVDPIPPAVAKGFVLVVFRTSEQGAVIEASAVNGSPELVNSALQAVKQWKFKPLSLSDGQPVQIHSAVVIDFSQNPPAIHAPGPMRGHELAPDLNFKCLNGLLHQDASSLEACKKQLSTVEHSRNTPMDHFTAEDEYGLALLNYAHDPKKAAEHFSLAIRVASEGLKPSDAEWAYAYWHRATAEQQLGNNINAEGDFNAAVDSMYSAEKTIGVDHIAGHYYRDLLAVIVKQYTSLLESENKNDEAKHVHAKFAQEQ